MEELWGKAKKHEGLPRQGQTAIIARPCHEGGGNFNLGHFEWVGSDRWSRIFQGSSDSTSQIEFSLLPWVLIGRKVGHPEEIQIFHASILVIASAEVYLSGSSELECRYHNLRCRNVTGAAIQYYCENCGLSHNQRVYRFLQNKLNGDLSGMHFPRKLFDYERRSGPIWGESWTFSKPRIGRRLIYPTHSTLPTLILIYFPHRMQIPSSHIYPPHMTLHTCHEIHKWMIFGPDVSFSTNSCLSSDEPLFEVSTGGRRERDEPSWLRLIIEAI